MYVEVTSRATENTLRLTIHVSTVKMHCNCPGCENRVADSFPTEEPTLKLMIGYFCSACISNQCDIEHRVA